MRTRIFEIKLEFWVQVLPKVLISRDKDVHKEQWRTGRFPSFPSLVAANHACYLEVWTRGGRFSQFPATGDSQRQGFFGLCLPGGRKQEHSGSHSSEQTWMNAGLADTRVGSGSRGGCF